MDGEGVHVNLWRQDAREEEGTDETWGVTFSAGKVVRVSWLPVGLALPYC